jgi:hypothetical protein
MQNITESLYFFLIKNQSNKTDNSQNKFYGLLQMKQNRFYLLHKDYSLIKLLQFLFLKYELFSVVNFKNFNFSANENIDNHDCSEWGGSPLMHKSLFFDIDSSKSTALLVKTQSVKEFFDINLQEKMFFVANILSKTKHELELFKDKELERINDTINGLKEFENFSKIISPNDSNISTFVKDEINLKKINLNFIDLFWNDLIQLLYNINLKEQTIEELSEKIKENIKSYFYKIKPSAALFSNFRNNLYQSLDIKTTF